MKIKLKDPVDRSIPIERSVVNALIKKKPIITANSPLAKLIREAVSNAIGDSHNGGKSIDFYAQKGTNLVRVRMHTIYEWSINVFGQYL